MGQKEDVAAAKAKRLEKNNRIIADYLSGMAIPAICIKNKCGNSRIYAVLDKNGIGRSRYELKESIRSENKEKKKEEASLAQSNQEKVEEVEVIDDLLPKRTCNKCSFDKNFHHFSKLATGPEGLNPSCKKCIKTYFMKYRKEYFKDPDNLQKRRDNDSALRNNRVKFIRDKKNIPCKDCDQKYDSYLMDFDHVSPIKKRKNISRLAMERASITIIEAEIAKCEVVCVWCHSIRTHERSKLKHNNDGLPTADSRRLKAIYSWNARMTPCEICKILYEPYQMQFDHMPGFTKIGSVSSLVNQNKPLEVIKAEIAKCQIVCCGCHRTKSLNMGVSEEDLALQEEEDIVE